jgi:interferon-induced transmembrane protein
MPSEPIPNYLVQSIIVTLCCCLPLGVVAIIFAAQVNSKMAAGDVAGAREASDKAKLFCWIAFGLGLAGIIIGFLINGAAILSQMGR